MGCLKWQEREIKMSVWKQITSDVLGKNVNEKMLENALADLGIGLDKTVKSIRNSWGSDVCDAALTRNGRVTAMGIRWTAKKGIELVGDTFNCNFGHGIYDKGQETLMNKIAQAYQVRHVKQQMALNNWMVEEQVTENGEIKLVFVQA
jgi:hypothetical protein